MNATPCKLVLLLALMSFAPAARAESACSAPSATACWLLLPSDSPNVSTSAAVNVAQRFDSSLAARERIGWSQPSGASAEPWWMRYETGQESYDPERCEIWLADDARGVLYTINLQTGARTDYRFAAGADPYDGRFLTVALRFDWIRGSLWALWQHWDAEPDRLVKYRVSGLELIPEWTQSLTDLGFGVRDNGDSFKYPDFRPLAINLASGNAWLACGRPGGSEVTVLLEVEGRNGTVTRTVDFPPEQEIQCWQLDARTGGLWLLLGQIASPARQSLLARIETADLSPGAHGSAEALAWTLNLCAYDCLCLLDLAVSPTDGSVWVFGTPGNCDTYYDRIGGGIPCLLQHISTAGVVLQSIQAGINLYETTPLHGDYLEATADGGCVLAVHGTRWGETNRQVHIERFDGAMRSVGFAVHDLAAYPAGRNILQSLITPVCLPPLPSAATDRARYGLGETVSLAYGARVRCDGIRELAYRVVNGAGVTVRSGTNAAPGGCSLSDMAQTAALAGLPAGLYTAAVTCVSCGSLPEEAACAFEMLDHAPPRPTASILREPFITAYGYRQDVRFRLRADTPESRITELRWWTEDTNGARVGAAQVVLAPGRASYDERLTRPGLPMGDYYLKARLTSEWGDIVEASSGRFRILGPGKEARVGFDPERYVILRYSDTCVPVTGWAYDDDGLTGYGVRWEGYGLSGDALPWRPFSAGWEPRADYWEPGCWPIPNAIWLNAQTQDVGLFYLVGQAAAVDAPGLVSNRLAVILMCPLEEILGLESAATKSAREFRSLFLNRSKDGRALVDLYYKHARELSGLVAKQSSLAQQAGSVLTAARPDIAALLKSGKPTLGPWAKENLKLVNPQTLAAARGLLVKAKPVASSSLRTAISDLINKLDAAQAALR